MTQNNAKSEGGTRIVTVCKECGLVDEDRMDPTVDADPVDTLQADPAQVHYDRTDGHPARSFSVKDAPDDIQEMVDRGHLSDGEIERIDDWIMAELWGVSDDGQ